MDNVRILFKRDIHKEKLVNHLTMVKEYYRLYLLLYLLFISFSGNCQGLKFVSGNELIKNRTSFCVFTDNAPKFKDSLIIDFDISIIKPNSYGYVIYINDESNNIFYNLTYYSYNDTLSYFNLSAKSEELLIEIPIDKRELGEGRWHNINIMINTNKDSIIISIDDKTYTLNKKMLHNQIIPQIYFGKHDSYIDVPSMAIRNLTIKNRHKEISFNFNESTGELVHDITGKSWGKVTNPVWLINKHYHWTLIKKLHFKQVSTISFDKKHQRFIILNHDSLLTFYPQNNSINIKTLKYKTPVELKLGMSFYDDLNNRLYVYEVNDVAEREPTIASIDLDNLTWEIHSFDQLNTQKHHHNSYFNNKTNEFMIFGGFGNRKYSNVFYKINLKKQNSKWKEVKFSGEVIPARFFAGITKKSESELLIYGGMGNPLGDQNVGKRYYHDCYLVNLKNKTIKRLWKNINDKNSLVSVRNMIMSKDSNYFYTIQYPEFNPNTYLKLYKIKIEDGTYEIVGDSVPMISERIRTNANLYLNKITDVLYLVTQEFQLDGSSVVKIYSLSFPPISLNDFFIGSEKISLTKKYSFLFSLLIIFFLIVAILKVIQKKRRNNRKNIPAFNKINANTTKRDVNAIYLFGEFKVFDRKGKDISYLFSPKIQQLFLMIFLNSEDKGVSSKNIYSVLWPYKSPAKSKNLKGVTLNKLRKVLTDIEGIELYNKNSQYYFKIDDYFFSDYLHLKYLLKIISNTEVQDDHFNDIIQILSRGRFLAFTDIEYFDSFKSNIENHILDTITNQIVLKYNNKDFLSVIKLSKIIYYIDPLNELIFNFELISYLKLNMDIEARKRFNTFLIDYQKEYNESYKVTFAEQTKKISHKVISSYLK